MKNETNTNLETKTVQCPHGGTCTFFQFDEAPCHECNIQRYAKEYADEEE